MKRIFIIAIAALLGCGFVSQAAAQEGEKVDPKARRAELRERFDKNADGKLDESERQALREHVRGQREKARAKFQKKRAEVKKRFDENGDGELDEPERQALQKHARGQREKARAKFQAERQKRRAERGEKPRSEGRARAQGQRPQRLNRAQRPRGQQRAENRGPDRAQQRGQNRAQGAPRHPNFRRLLVRRFDHDDNGKLGPVERSQARRFLRRLARGLRHHRMNAQARQGQGRERAESQRPGKRPALRRNARQGFRRPDMNRDGRVGPVERQLLRRRMMGRRHPGGFGPRSEQL